MKFRWSLFLLVALGSTAAAAPAEPKSAFAQQVAAHAHRLELRPDGSLAGPGAELIARESGKAQFLMVGEQHATAGIAEVNLALHRIASEQGYNHAALEIGPHSTQEVERLVRNGKGSLARFVRSPGKDFVFPFLGWAEEAALVEQIVALSPADRPVLWGLDQEFVGSAPIHIERLRSFARTAEQESLLAELEEQAAANPNLIGMPEPHMYERLRSAFPAQEYEQAAALIEDLAASSAIYAPFAGRGGSRQAANSARELYLKRNFLNHFERAEARSATAPKVFLKFGANHAMRGHSLSDVPALGNFLAEWGISRGFTMVNLLVDCVGGEQSDARTGKGLPCSSYFDLPPHSPFRAAPPSPRALTLFDLRPLRAAMPKDIDAATRRMILGFDFYIPVHGPAPATLLSPVAAGRN